MRRYRNAQVDRTLRHSRLPQPTLKAETNARNSINDGSVDESLGELRPTRSEFCFVVAADTQIGMKSQCEEWETELAYSRQAIQMINSLEPRPLFCCMCGDLVHMEYTFFLDRTKWRFTKDDCHRIQQQQNVDFQTTWNDLHEDIALVCLCGNHDLGNRPTQASIEKFTNLFGNDYLAFWVNGTYNIVLNTTLISDPSLAQELHQGQLTWFQERLQYAKRHNATQIFVFGHHPWFLYHEEETANDLKGFSTLAEHARNTDQSGFKVPDHYFHIPKEQRMPFIRLFRDYNVTAAFSGHFHQNLVSKASFGMDMIITSSLSQVLESTGKPDDPKNGPLGHRGFRVVNVHSDTHGKDNGFTHHFVSLQEEEKSVPI